MKILEKIRGNYRKYILLLFDSLCFCAVDAVFYFLSTSGSHSSSIAVKDLDVFLRNSAIMLLMVLVFICTGIMNRLGADEEGGVVV